MTSSYGHLPLKSTTVYNSKEFLFSANPTTGGKPSWSSFSTIKNFPPFSTHSATAFSIPGLSIILRRFTVTSLL